MCDVSLDMFCNVSNPYLATFGCFIYMYIYLGFEIIIKVSSDYFMGKSCSIIKVSSDYFMGNWGVRLSR